MHAGWTKKMLLASVVAGVGLGGGRADADSIRLKASVRMPAGAETVRLADVAVLEGDEAEAQGELLLATLDATDRPLEIALRDVRAALDAAGIHWGRVNLSGGKVVVRPRVATSAAAPAAMTGASLVGEDAHGRQEPMHDDRSAASLVDEPTVRGEVARQMVRGLAVAPRSLRLLFGREDAALLDAGNGAGRLEVIPDCNIRSNRVTFVVRVWTESRVTAEGRVEVNPLVHAPQAQLRRDIDRDALMLDSDFEVTEQWMSPVQADGMCAPDEIIGRVAARRLHAGDVLRRAHLARRTIVERGDRLTVRCLVGGIVIAMQAEARADGADGDHIECRKLGERTTFMATVTGRGEAVVDLGRPSRRAGSATSHRTPSGAE